MSNHQKILAWLNDIREGAGYFCLGSPGDWGQIWFNNHEKSLITAIDTFSDNRSVYVSMATFPNTAKGRTQDGAEKICSLWLDLDSHGGGKYTTPDDALEDLKVFIRDSKIPSPTHIHHTGHGIHAHWALKEALTPKEWLIWAQKLRNAAEFYGLDIDGEVTTDAARVLRIPYTKNFRDPANPVDTYLLEGDHE